MKQIEIAAKDKTNKEELEYFICDKFRQLAEALRIAIPGLNQYLPDTDSLSDPPIDLVAFEDRLKKEEQKQKNTENERLNKELSDLKEQILLNERNQNEKFNAIIEESNNMKMHKQMVEMSRGIQELANRNMHELK